MTGTQPTRLFLLFAALSLVAAQGVAQPVGQAAAAQAASQTAARTAVLPEIHYPADFLAALRALRDSVYESGEPSEVEKAATELARSAAARGLGEPALPLALATMEYLAGRSWNEAGDKKKAIPHFEAAVTHARLAMKSGEYPAGLMALTKPLSELCLLKGMGFLIANGPRISENARKILAMEPDHAGAIVTLAAAKAYPPPIFGGNPAEAIARLTELLAARGSAFEKDELFDIRTCMGTAEAKLGHKPEARAWFEAALALYPRNRFALAELEKATR